MKILWLGWCYNLLPCAWFELSLPHLTTFDLIWLVLSYVSEAWMIGFLHELDTPRDCYENVSVQMLVDKWIVCVTPDLLKKICASHNAPLVILALLLICMNMVWCTMYSYICQIYTGEALKHIDCCSPILSPFSSLANASVYTHTFHKTK